jgi:hypothetical protein
LVVHIKPQNVLVCLKLTSSIGPAKWGGRENSTIGSIYRALLYLPIAHATRDGDDYHELYGTPLLYQDSRQRHLQYPSYVNTEKLFEIEQHNVVTYSMAIHSRHRTTKRWLARWRRDKKKSYGFSLNVDSMK